MNKFDEQISNLLRSNVKEPSVEVMGAIDKKLNELPPRPQTTYKKRKTLWSLASVAILFLILALSMFHPSISNAIQQLPFIGQVFQHIDDKGLERVSELGLSSPVFMSYTHNDVTITITELMNDGNRLNIGYTETHNEPINFSGKTEGDFHLTASRLYINDQWPTGYVFGGGVEKQISDHELIGLIQLELLDEDLTDIDSLQFSLFRLGKFSGEWDFKLENIPLISDSMTIVIDKEFKIDDQFSIYIDRIKNSSATIGVFYEFIEHNKIPSLDEKYYTVDTFYNLEGERYDWLPGPNTRLIPKGNDRGIVLSIFQREKFFDIRNGQRILVDQPVSEQPTTEIEILFSDFQ